MITSSCKVSGFKWLPEFLNQAEHCFPGVSYFDQAYTKLESWSWELMIAKANGFHNVLNSRIQLQRPEWDTLRNPLLSLSMT